MANEQEKTMGKTEQLPDAGRPPGKKTARRIVMVLIVLGCLALLFVLGRFFFPGKESAPAGRPPVPVRVAEATKSDFPVHYSSLGTVTALNTVTVKSRVDGELVGLYFQEGQIVQAGELLAQIDPRPFQAEVEQMHGQLLRDQALLTNARQNLVRSEELLPLDSITPQEVDANRAQVRQYEGAVRLDKGQLDAAKLQLEYARITAPIGGKLGLRNVDVGNIIHESDTNGIVVITQVLPINVIFTVTEAQLPSVLDALRTNPALPVEAWDRTKTTLLATGKVVSIDNQVNTSTGTVRVKAEFENSDDRLFPNLFVNAKIQVGIAKDACIVPAAAIQLGNQGSFVYVAEEDNRVSLRTVETGPGDDDNVVVLKGVVPGEKVVTDGLDQLRDKSPVTLVTEEDRNGGVRKAAPKKDGKNDNGQQPAAPTQEPAVTEAKPEEKPEARPQEPAPPAGDGAKEGENGKKQAETGVQGAS